MDSFEKLPTNNIFELQLIKSINFNLVLNYQPFLFRNKCSFNMYR